jgi:hypothetical protein
VTSSSPPAGSSDGTSASATFDSAGSGEGRSPRRSARSRVIGPAARAAATCCSAAPAVSTVVASARVASVSGTQGVSQARRSRDWSPSVVSV